MATFVTVLFTGLLMAGLVWAGWRGALYMLQLERDRLTATRRLLDVEWRALDDTRRVREVFWTARRTLRRAADESERSEQR